MSQRRMPPSPIESLPRVRYWVRRLMDSREMTMVDVAARAGISRSALYHFLEGEGRDTYLGTVEALAQALGVEVGDLLRAIPEEDADG